MRNAALFQTVVAVKGIMALSFSFCVEHNIRPV